MLFKVFVTLATLLLFFVFYVNSREAKFHYERSGVIKATPEVIWPHISQFTLGQAWSPYAKKDPSMTTTFSEKQGEIGSTMSFESDRAGSGNLEITSLIPYQEVTLRLTMTKPFTAVNVVKYSLTPDPNGTKFTWSMDGDNGFLGKMMGVLIDCEKMVADDFTVGIENLKRLIEGPKQ
jgi:hypothetical protein